MKVNDIYKTESSLFPAKQNDIARTNSPTDFFEDLLLEQMEQS